jgi:hypothetical protein
VTRPLDYTVAVDDQLVQRPTHCLLCGLRLGEMRHTGWWCVHGVCLLVTRCLPCRRDNARMQALLEARYAPGRFAREGTA